MENIKRGQLTLFVIVAIVIVLTIGLYFMLSSSETEAVGGGELTGSLDEKISVIREDLLDCFAGVYRDSLEDVGLGGGYYFEPLTMYLEGEDIRIPFYYTDGLEYIPDEIFVRSEIINEVEDTVFVCLESLEEYSLEYDYLYNTVNVTIEDDDVIFTPNIDLTLIQDGEQRIVDFSERSVRVGSHIRSLRNFANYIALSYYMSEGYLCLDCYLETALHLNITVESDDSLAGVIVFTLTDVEEGNFPLYYNFAVMVQEDEFNIEDLLVTESYNDHAIFGNEKINVSQPGVT